jgi:hypothetical protein
MPGSIGVEFMGFCPHLLIASGISMMAVPAAAEEPDAGGSASATTEQESGWQFSASPYLWMAGMKGDLGVVEEVEPVGIDFSFLGDILGALKFAAMGRFDARNGRFVASADIFYISLAASDNIEIREVDLLEADLTSKLFISTLAAGYRVVDQDRLSVDLLAGGRLQSMKNGLDLTGPQRSVSGSKRETWIDPIVAVRFQAPLGEDWSLNTYGDIGGFGVASHLTWQLLGEVQYDLSDRWSLSAGWRHLDTDYEHDGFVLDASIDGPVLGATYRF